MIQLLTLSLAWAALFAALTASVLASPVSRRQSRRGGVATSHARRHRCHGAARSGKRRDRARHCSRRRARGRAPKEWATSVWTTFPVSATKLQSSRSGKGGTSSHGGGSLTGSVEGATSTSSTTSTVTSTSTASYSTTVTTSATSTSTSVVSSTTTTTTTTSSSTTTKPAAPFRFFAPTSIWNAEPSASSPLDPASAQLINAFDTEIEREIASGTGPWINTTNYSIPIYTVPASQPTVKVKLVSTYSAPALEEAWSAVPMPPEAKPAEGTDGTLVIWQPSSDRLWEFWRAAHTTEGWQANWGGAIEKVSSNDGVYGPEAWPGAQTWWGSSASSLSIAGGVITLEDLERGEIDHALAMAAPEIRSKVYASPAQRTDGTSTNLDSLPEGVHLRLDPTLDLSTLKLPPLTLMIAKAAQRYGIFVRDRAKNVHLFAQDPSPLGTNPYIGPTGYFEGKSPAQLLASFPWRRLQVLPMELHEGP